MDIKRNAHGVVDAISAEDIGKFPDTNLAESLQRITGVSIDRNSGEGSRVTVRGFGPEFNLVLLNGRQMPTSSLGDGASPPSSRSFDFGNLASEGIASVEVYKSGRATLPTGGIGSVINIRTPRPLDRPGFRGSLSAKGGDRPCLRRHGTITPEFSGIISKTFADDKVGILCHRFVSAPQVGPGAIQRRLARRLPWDRQLRHRQLGRAAAEPTGAGAAIPTMSRTGRKADTVYQMPQNAAYDFTDIDRERINGQLVLQVRADRHRWTRRSTIPSRKTQSKRDQQHRYLVQPS